MVKCNHCEEKMELIGDHGCLNFPDELKGKPHEYLVCGFDQQGMPVFEVRLLQF